MSRMRPGPDGWPDEPWIGELLERERHAPGPGGEVEQRVLARLEATLGLPPAGDVDRGTSSMGGEGAPTGGGGALGAGPAGVPGASAGVPGASVIGGTVLGAKGLIFAVLGLAGGIFGLAVLLPEDPSPSPVAVPSLTSALPAAAVTAAQAPAVVSAPASRPAPVVSPEPASTVELTSSGAGEASRGSLGVALAASTAAPGAGARALPGETGSRPRKARPAPSRPDPPVAASPATTLAEERRVLEDARRRLAAGDPAGALAEVERHRHTFARGQLAEERDALEVLALLAAGREGEARAQHRRFRARHPHSFLLPSLEEALGLPAAP